MTYKLKVLQQGLEQEEAAHKATKARLADKNKISESIEGAKSEAVKGMRAKWLKIIWNAHFECSFLSHVGVFLIIKGSLRKLNTSKLTEVD